MTVRFRDAEPADAPALAELGRDTVVETFGHLYRPEDLALFLETHDCANWAAEIADPDYAVRVGEADGGLVAYAKVGPPKLPFVPDAGAIELRQFYIRRPWQGRGTTSSTRPGPPHSPVVAGHARVG